MRLASVMNRSLAALDLDLERTFRTCFRTSWPATTPAVSEVGTTSSTEKPPTRSLEVSQLSLERGRDRPAVLEALLGRHRLDAMHE